MLGDNYQKDRRVTNRQTMRRPIDALDEQAYKMIEDGDLGQGHTP